MTKKLFIAEDTTPFLPSRCPLTLRRFYGSALSAAFRHKSLPSKEPFWCKETFTKAFPPSAEPASLSGSSSVVFFPLPHQSVGGLVPLSKDSVRCLVERSLFFRENFFFWCASTGRNFLVRVPHMTEFTSCLSGAAPSVLRFIFSPDVRKLLG